MACVGHTAQIGLGLPEIFGTKKSRRPKDLIRGAKAALRAAIGSREQIFGANRQVPRGAQRDQEVLSRLPDGRHRR